MRALAQTLTRKETLDDKVDRALASLANDIIDDVVDFACRLAKHRGSNSLHRDDVRLAFTKRLKVRMPTKVASSSAAASSISLIAAAPPATSTSGYKSNLALVRRAQDHYIQQDSAILPQLGAI